MSSPRSRAEWHRVIEGTPGVIRVAHVWSHDLGIPAGMPYCLPLLERGWKITVITPDGPQVPNARGTQEWTGCRWPSSDA